MKAQKHSIKKTTLTTEGDEVISGKDMRYKLFSVSSGVRVNGRIMLPSNASATSPVPGAVLCHGFGADQNVMESSALLLVKKGIATIVFDLRGHGSSEGYLDGNFEADVITAWQLLVSLHEVDSSRIALIGHSLGAFSSILAARIIKPKAIVALSCPYEIQGTLLKWYSHKDFPLVMLAINLIVRLVIWFNHLKAKVDLKKCLESWSQVNLASSLAGLDKCYKLFIFSEGDKLTPYKMFEQVYENAPTPKRKMLTKGSHSTPIEAEILRFEWVGWVVSVLTTQ